MSLMVSVIVGECYPASPTGARIHVSTNETSRFTSIQEAFAFGHSKRAVGFAVIVRPTYNEKDSCGEFYREWRSFNSSAFEEYRWMIGG